MSDTPLLDYQHNKAIVKQVRKGQREALVMPVLEGHAIQLRYVKGVLQLKEFSERKQHILQTNRIPLNLYTNGEWGGLNIKDLTVHCVVAKKLLVAERVTTPKGDYLSLIQNLNVLIHKGFITPMILSGWMNFGDCEGSADAEKLLRKRLKLVKQVQSGARRSLWTDVEVSQPSPLSLDWSVFPPIRHLLVCDPIGFVPTVKSAKVQAIYKGED